MRLSHAGIYQFGGRWGSKLLCISEYLRRDQSAGVLTGQGQNLEYSASIRSIEPNLLLPDSCKAGEIRVTSMSSGREPSLVDGTLNELVTGVVRVRFSTL